MGKIVYGALVNIAVASDATQDIWNLMGASGVRVTLHGWELTSDTLTAELVSLTLTRVSSGGTGGAGVTEQLRDSNDAALGGIFQTGVTTPGTPTGNLMGYQWEQLGPVGHIFTPEMRPVAELAAGFALVCNTATEMTVSGWVCWEES